MTAALRVWWRLRRSGARENRVPDVLAVLAFAVSTAAVLVCLGGLGAFRQRNAGPDPEGVATLYVTLALVATGLMLVPILTLGSTAARLAVARRDQRMAALRLAGATAPQVGLMTLAEAAAQALVGAVLGTVVYAACLAPLSLLTFQGRRFVGGELWVGPWTLLGVVAGVAALAVVSGVSSLARVAVSPLGVAARTTPSRLKVVRVVIALAAVVGWIVVNQLVGGLGFGVLVLVLVGVVATINLVGPYVVMLFGLAVAATARRLPTLLAARRIVDDPRSTWRAVGAIGLGVLVAGLSSILAGAGGTGAGGDGQRGGAEQYLSQDIATGSLLTLVIIAVVAATSTGVVQAARVLDQRGEYHALALAGTDVSVLHAARLREVAIPLAATVLLSGGFVLLLFVPFAQAIGLVLLGRFVLAVVVATALLLLAVVASRSLVRQACELA